jgi:hypothetical protein
MMNFIAPAKMKSAAIATCAAESAYGAIDARRREPVCCLAGAAIVNAAIVISFHENAIVLMKHRSAR